MSTPASATVAEQPDSELRRSITGRLLFFYVLGDVLGSGIYVLIGLVAAAVGGAFWIAFAAGVTVAIITGLAYAELVTKYPQAAGAALYVNKAFRNPALTFLITICMLSAVFAASGSLATGFARYFQQVFESSSTLLVTLLFILALTIVNYIGITESVVTNMLMTFVELAGLLIVLIIGVIHVARGDARLGVLTDFSTSGSPIFAIVVTGFENAANVAEETVNPSVTFPRALVGGMVAAGVIYVLVAMTAALVVPISELGGSEAALLEVVRAGVLPVPVGFMVILFAIIAMVAITNTTLVSVVTQSRILYGPRRCLPRCLRPDPPEPAQPVGRTGLRGPGRCDASRRRGAGDPRELRRRHRGAAGHRHSGVHPVHLCARHRLRPQAARHRRPTGHLPGQHPAALPRDPGQRRASRVRRRRRPGVAVLGRWPAGSGTRPLPGGAGHQPWPARPGHHRPPAEKEV